MFRNYSELGKFIKNDEEACIHNINLAIDISEEICNIFKQYKIGVTIGKPVVIFVFYTKNL